MNEIFEWLVGIEEVMIEVDSWREPRWMFHLIWKWWYPTLCLILWILFNILKYIWYVLVEYIDAKGTEIVWIWINLYYMVWIQMRLYNIEWHI